MVLVTGFLIVVSQPFFMFRSTLKSLHRKSGESPKKQNFSLFSQRANRNRFCREILLT